MINSCKIGLIGLLMVAISANAQKLPNKQETSVWAPADIKIDGKATEWNGQFHAYNKDTQLFYTMANDDNSIFLTLKATDQRVIQKIMGGSVTFIISNSGKKDNEGNATVTYPLLSYEYVHHILIDLGITPGENGLVKPTDSLTQLADKILAVNAKEIKLNGMKDITDTITGITTNKRGYFRVFPLFYRPGKYISTNNSYNIKAMAGFDQKGSYIYELAIPLKYLALSFDGSGKVTYGIKINGLMDEKGRPASGVSITYVRSSPGGSFIDPNQDLDNPTDFWGEYTLAKKP